MIANNRLNGQGNEVLQSRSQERPANIYLWVLSAILLFQGFLAVGGFLRTLVYSGDRLETPLPTTYWWTAVPLQTSSWLLLVPLIAAIIVDTRSSLRMLAVLHLGVVFVAVLVSGIFLHHFAHIQSDQLKNLVETKLAFDSKVAKVGLKVQQEQQEFDLLSATADYRNKSYKGVHFHNSYGFQYWFGETSSIVAAYFMLIAVGYSVLYFRLTQFRTRQAQCFRTSMLQLQYDSLCNRLTPHFLFNTLNTISALTLTDGDAARTCISQLGELLRASIEALPEGEIKLERELEILQTYLAIQQTRFGSVLTYSLEVEQDLETALVPAFLLQPLVENCFKHGFKEQRKTAIVSVSIRREKDSCRLEVSDNGIANESSETINEKYGLGLTRQRLELQYGSQADLRYERNHPQGLKVIVLIPLRHEVDRAHE